MARIAIVIDGELSHFLPTQKLARQLLRRGHRVTYLGFPALKQRVRDRGFEFVAIFEELVSTGLTSTDGAVTSSALFRSVVQGGPFERVVSEIAPDLFITITVFCPMALLLRYRYQRPVVLLRTHGTLLKRMDEFRKILASELMHQTGNVVDFLRLLSDSGLSIHSIADLTVLALAMPELVLLPPEFALPEQRGEEGLLYVGSGIEPEDSHSFPWERMPATDSLIYCSLGTRPDLNIAISQRFLRLVVQVIAAESHFQLVVSTGGRLPSADFKSGSPNICVADWVPQSEVLQRTRLMITHGGLGSIQECIMAGVPMIVFPVLRDQFAGAARVQQLGLGLGGDIRSIDARALQNLVQSVSNDPAYAKRVSAMRDCFRRSSFDLGIGLIEELAEKRLTHPADMTLVGNRSHATA